MGWSRRDFVRLIFGTAAAGLLPSLSSGHTRGAIAGGTPPQPGNAGAAERPQSTPKVPVIYSTDLFHPPGDPDDHVDLATLFALPELDVRAIILDQGDMQGVKSGQVPVKQIMALTGRQVPFAAGLGTALRYPEDKGLNQFSFYQTGVNLILKVLGESTQPAYIITTGSVRDVLAAFNREPELFREKVERIYVNAGNSGGGDLYWNPSLDPQAYIRLMRAGLPVYWCPCFGGRMTIEDIIRNGLGTQQYQTYWRFRQSEIFASLPTPLQNYFLYALGEKIVSQVDPLGYLSQAVEPVLREKQWGQTRNMWSTASLYHAAGRKLYRAGDSWAARHEPEPGYALAEVFDFVPAEVTIDRDLTTIPKISGAAGPLRLFHLLDLANYEKAMLVSLRRLLAEMPLASQYAGKPGVA
jgi:hypothetical protein